MGIYAIHFENDTAMKCQAGLVAQGCSQIYGTDYRQTFSVTTVVKQKSLGVILALSAMKKYILETMEFTTAYI